MTAFIMNMILATIWLMLRKNPSVSDFFVGFVIGFIVIIPFSKLLKGKKYTKRVLKITKFILIFLIEFIKSNLSVAYIILFVSKSKIKPVFFDYDIDGLNFIETVLLSYCITLTPGTISVKAIPDKNTLVVHCLDGRTLEKTKSRIDDNFKRNILGFTR